MIDLEAKSVPEMSGPTMYWPAGRKPSMYLCAVLSIRTPESDRICTPDPDSWIGSMSCDQDKDCLTFTALASLGGVNGLGYRVLEKTSHISLVTLMLSRMHRMDILNILSHA